MNFRQIFSSCTLYVLLYYVRALIFKITETIPKAMQYNDGSFVNENLMVLEL